VLWLARGGALLASLASTIPAWASMDPLPVLSRFKPREGDKPRTAAAPAAPNAADRTRPGAPGTEDGRTDADNQEMPAAAPERVEQMFDPQQQRRERT
jgi:hypothetical protein